MTIVMKRTCGFLGLIAFGLCALLPLLGYATSRSNTVVALIPTIRIVDFDPPSDGDSTHTHKNLAISTGADEELVRSASEKTLRHKVELLDRGRLFLKTTGDYTAKLQKQEVVRGNLLDEQTISLKCRHSPFSVYLLWETGDTGREVIYVDESRDGKMIAHDGGWKARIPALTLSTDSYLAMRDARYPVTLAGLQGLIDIMRGIHLDDLARSTFASCELNPEGEFDGRRCYVFTTQYKSAADSPTYRKSVTCIDREWNVPVHSRHFEWPASGASSAKDQLDGATLIESYSFTKLTFCQTLTDRDFDRTNPEYDFR